METKFAVRHGSLTEKIQSSADAALTRIGKIVGSGCTANIVLTAENSRQTAEVTITCKHHTIVAKAEGFDQEQVLHAALEKAEKQAQRYVERLRTRKRKPLAV